MEIKAWLCLAQLRNKTFLCPAVKMEEAVSLEMDNHVLDKEEGCYDNTEAAFSDDEEEVNNKGDDKRLEWDKPDEIWFILV